MSYGVGSDSIGDLVRIAFIITRADSVGGAQLYLREISTELVSRGHQITVLAGGSGPFAEQLRELGIQVRLMKCLIHPIRPWTDAIAIFELRRQLAGIAPDLISLHSSKAGWLGRLAARSLRLPVVFTAHGWAFADGVPAARRWIYQFAERIAAPLATRIITVSEHDRDLALRAGVGVHGQVIAIHNGTSDVPATLIANPRQHPPRMIMVARFSEPKDHEALVVALSGLQHLPWNLELVGDGPLRRRVQNTVRKLGLAHRIHFPGECDDVAARLARAQVFLLISNWEGFPRSILEAMRAGLAVVATRVGGISEAVVDGHTGYLVPRRDIGALQDRLRPLLSDENLRAELGQNGRRRYEANFTFDQMFAKTLDAYEDAYKSAARVGAINRTS